MSSYVNLNGYCTSNLGYRGKAQSGRGMCMNNNMWWGSPGWSDAGQVSTVSNPVFSYHPEPKPLTKHDAYPSMTMSPMCDATVPKRIDPWGEDPRSSDPYVKLLRSEGPHKLTPIAGMPPPREFSMRQRNPLRQGLSRPGSQSGRLPPVTHPPPWQASKTNHLKFERSVSFLSTLKEMQQRDKYTGGRMDAAFHGFM